ncbi:MAG: winged helix-turn-helix transcriptional regulator [Sphaerospermopsis sp. SIO1G2]|nr:winged helix-turn-helix transcriptional regulator [Sphaerospermopsis sp. SIO1G1]NET73377.1 winged helix-turn-helix transcriptional regulator [Sphaerospermopsis sp. SIO1G2]
MITPITKTPNVIISGFHALSDPIRMNVIELLRHRELCVCDLCDTLKISQSKLSFHLKNLKEANLVNTRQEGKWIYYSLNLHQFQVLEQYLADIHHNSVLSPPRSCCD